MNIDVTISFWFLISLCLAFALVGVLFGARAASRGDRYRL